MANRILKTALLNGSKFLALHVYLESDGNEGDEMIAPLGARVAQPDKQLVRRQHEMFK